MFLSRGAERLKALLPIVAGEERRVWEGGGDMKKGRQVWGGGG